MILRSGRIARHISASRCFLDLRSIVRSCITRGRGGWLDLPRAPILCQISWLTLRWVIFESTASLSACQLDQRADIRSPNSMSSLGCPRSKIGYTKSISKSNRNCLGAARLVCMTEVSDLPNPVAACRRLSRDADVAAQRFWYGPREKATALWTRERYG